ncbi:hypothetical protein BBJ28_00021168 [Nothophytophthora sp. Chile5]|nr:hypothetical protein BBJ28_00021168 [Nothophytophthora sp. Chile5]
MAPQGDPDGRGLLRALNDLHADDEVTLARSVIVWHIEEFKRVTQSILVENLPAEPGWLAFDDTGTLVAVASDRDVRVFVIERKEVLVTLEGHIARFSLCIAMLLALALVADGRGEQIWDLAAKCLWFQSAVLSAFAILSMALNPVNGDAAFGFADGSVKVFALLGGYAKEVATVNVETFVRRLLRRKQDSRLPERSSPSASRELEFNGHGSRELLEHEQFLVVGVPGFLLSVNAYSFEVVVIHDFQQALPSASTLDPISVAREFCFHRPPRSRVLECGVLSAFQPCATMFSTTTPVSKVSKDRSGNQARESRPPSEEKTWRTASSDNNAAERVSVLPSGPPPRDSVLNLPPLAAGRKNTPPKGAKNLDKPITFHSRVKSSGYGSATSSFGTKRTPPKPRKSRLEARTKATTPPTTPVEAYMKEYPTNCELLQHFQPKHALPPRTLHHGAILHIEYSSDAKWLATSGGDRVAQVCKLPFSRFAGEGNVLAGHDQAVRAIHWSQNDRMVVTVAGDKTSRLWLADSDTPSLILHGAAPPSSVATTAAAMGSMLGGSSSAKKAIKQDVVDARFFYMDKFLLSACGNTARLHQFELDEVYARAASSNSKGKSKTKKSDIEVLENQSRKKQVAHWSFDDMQSVTSLACVNGGFLSSVAVVAGSDRSLRVLDVGAAGGGRTVRVMRDAHSRAAHTVALPRPSCFASHPSNLYDLLLSSAPDSTTHLWDIRADNCVMRFCEHVNRVHALGVAFSPCMRYVATGSEDRAAYIYDIRTGRRLVKLKGHSDVVTSVAFSPLHPQLATASYDGSVRFYSSDRAE